MEDDESVEVDESEASWLDMSKVGLKGFKYMVSNVCTYIGTYS
jgi:hypothetical protein